VPTGYQVAFVPFKDGRPAGGYITFLDGFRIDGREGEAVRAEVWGRPAGVAVAADGSLLVSDDTANTIWRVRWVGR
jgi:glucose/arabinose dehydrogenase